MECPVSERLVGGGTPGAAHEVAQRLQARLGESVLFLSGRRLATECEGGDFVTVAVAPTGVWIIDPKKHGGKKVRAHDGTFVIGGRHAPEFAAGMSRRVAAVQAAVLRGPVPDAPINALHCFVDAGLPLRRLTVGGVDATTVRGARKRLQQPGPLDAVHRMGLHAYLGLEFPSV